MIRRFSVFLLAFVLIFAMYVPNETKAFSMTISPSSRRFNMERGESIDFVVRFTNNSESGAFDINLYDIVIAADGSRRVISQSDLADPSQSMLSWLVFDNVIEAESGKVTNVVFSLSVPDFATFGDHYASLYFSPHKMNGSAVVGVSGAITSFIYLKVLGGEEVKSGNLLDFSVESREKARNTVNFVAKYRNIGSVFFDVLAEVSVFDSSDMEEPIKVIRDSFVSFPNVVKAIKIPLGNLGDDYGEGTYYSILELFEFENGVKKKILSEDSSSFEYFLPYTGAALEPDVIEVEKEVIVSPPIVQIVKELALYIGGLLLLLIILIVVLLRTWKRK